MNLENLEKDFLHYIRSLKELIKSTKDGSLAFLAEEWTLKLMLQREKPDLRNYVLFHVVQQFIENEFKPWFNKQNLLCSVEKIAKEIHSDLTSKAKQPNVNKGAGDTKSLGKIKYERIQNWIEKVKDSETTCTDYDNKLRCLYSNLHEGTSDSLICSEQNFDESLSTVSTSVANFLSCDATPLSLYQKFITEYLPLIITRTTNTSKPSFNCHEKYQNEFATYEKNIVKRVNEWHHQVDKLNTKIDEQKSVINELETQVNQLKSEKFDFIDKCVQTDKSCIHHETHQKPESRRVKILKQKFEEYADYKNDVERKCKLINEVLVRSKSQLVTVDAKDIEEIPKRFQNIDTNCQ